MSTQPQPFLTPEQYLEIERKAEFKSEYYRGEMFAMAGGSYRHSRIIANMTVAFSLSLAASDCDVVTQDLRVATSPDGLYCYPDLIVVCGQPEFLDAQQDTLTNPLIIVEVLSPSTAGYDRGARFEIYRAISSLSDYIIVAQDRVHIEVHSRQPDGRWMLAESGSLDDTIRVPSVLIDLPVSDIYRRVAFESR